MTGLKLIRYTASKTGSNRRKLSKVSSKVLNIPTNKRGFDQDIYQKVREFYARDDNSTALPGKRDVKSTRRGTRLQKRALNDYLGNLFQKIMAENPNLKLSFATFARMRPANYVLANFVNRRSCLCTQHQNIALKLKMLNKINKVVPTHPDVFIKNNVSHEDINKIFESCNVTEYKYEEWRKVPITIKTKAGEEKLIKKMKIVKQAKTKTDFEQYFRDQIVKFRDHTHRIKCQFNAQRLLKSNLPPNQVYIHMDFAEDYRCRTQEEIQSAYWSQTQVTIHPVVAYYKEDDKLLHQSFVFVSDEPRHDARFVFALIRLLIPMLKELLPDLGYIHYWTDSPTSQYRNKSIFKIVSCHEEYFNISASWNYMESGHGKGPCDPIGGTAKRKDDLAVKNDKAVIQDAMDFFTWVRGPRKLRERVPSDLFSYQEGITKMLLHS